jgi:hypothetical protein
MGTCENCWRSNVWVENHLCATCRTHFDAALSGQGAPRGQKADRLLDIRTIVELLSDSYTDEGIDIWLHSRNRNLDLRRPIELLTEGKIDEVLEQARWVAGGM